MFHTTKGLQQDAIVTGMYMREEDRGGEREGRERGERGERERGEGEERERKERGERGVH